jgi:hypothetical protein
MLIFPKNRSWQTVENALTVAGIRLAYINNIPQFDESAAQTIIDACDILPEWKETRIAGIKAEGLSRIQAVLPGITSFDTLELIREVWLSIAPAARAPTSPFNSVINIYSAGRTAILSIKAATTVAQVDAVTPSWP